MITTDMIAVSDLHLGCKHSRSRELLDFLKSADPRQIYLLGDIFDGYKWGSNWHWTKYDEQLLHHLLTHALTEGQTLFYTPGNHDDFMRSIPCNDVAGGRIRLANEFIYNLPEEATPATPSKRIANEMSNIWELIKTHEHEGEVISSVSYKMPSFPKKTKSPCLMLHGDIFDNKREMHPVFYQAGDFLYDVLLSISRGVFGARAKFAGWIKSRTKGVVKYINSYEEHLCEYAYGRYCNTVICGHIHTPIDKLVNISPKPGQDGSERTIRYLNCGSWITGEYNGVVLEEKGDLKLITI